MNFVTIPFRPEFREPMLAGIKRCTSRSKIMGKPGDYFLAFGKTFRLLSVTDVDLYSVSLLWEEEGCTSRQHFIEIWNAIHPRKQYSDSQRTYLHRFELKETA